ncbi:hypothetical protein B0H11DRAFT_1993213 [Mycena galericulata]|nr:hypothetical protein B0H11DRAFT_1993213 [Mycena galericulata]
MLRSRRQSMHTFQIHSLLSLWEETPSRLRTVQLSARGVALFHSGALVLYFSCLRSGGGTDVGVITREFQTSLTARGHDMRMVCASPLILSLSVPFFSSRDADHASPASLVRSASNFFQATQVRGIRFRLPHESHAICWLVLFQRRPLFSVHQETRACFSIAICSFDVPCLERGDDIPERVLHTKLHLRESTREGSVDRHPSAYRSIGSRVPSPGFRRISPH